MKIIVFKKQGLKLKDKNCKLSIYDTLDIKTGSFPSNARKKGKILIQSVYSHKKF